METASVSFVRTKANVSSLTSPTAQKVVRGVNVNPFDGPLSFSVSTCKSDFYGTCSEDTNEN